MSQARLAIIVDSAAKPSETFIRDHIAHVAPGRTVVVSMDDSAGAAGAVAGLGGIGGLAKGDLIRAAATRVLRGRLSDLYPLPLAPDQEDRLIAFLKAQGVTHVMVEYAHVAAQMAWALQRAGVRWWVHAHGMDVTSLTGIPRLRDAIHRALLRADGVMVPSRYIAGVVADMGVAQPRITVSPCGVDPRAFAPATPEPGRLLMVGRLVEKKAPLVTLEALRRLRAQGHEVTLDLVGDGPLSDAVASFLRDAQLEDCVTCHGFLDHSGVQALMRRAAVFAQHSVTAANGDREGLPVALLEAMASGVPVVSTRHSGIPEAVIEGETGYLVDEHDVDGFTARLGDLLTAPETAQAMGRAGRQRFEEVFTQEKMAIRLREAMGLTEGS